jgi:hypothetical protein
MNRLLTIFALIFSVIFSSTSFAADRYVCKVETKRSCNEKGCKDVQILGDDYRIIDKGSRTYTIGKDQFPLEDAKISGAFEIFKVGGAGFLKMIYIEETITQLKRGEFIEVRDMFLSVITSHGLCRF